MITAAKQADVFNETGFISIQNTEPMLPFWRQCIAHHSRTALSAQEARGA